MATSFIRTTRSLKHDSPAGALFAWGIGAIALTAWLIWFFAAHVTLYEVSAKARLEVIRSAHPVASLVSGRIESVSFNLGQDVRAGDVLVTLDSHDRRLMLAEEVSRAESLPPQIALLEQQIEQLRLTRSKDQQSMQSAVGSAQSRRAAAEAAVSFANEYERRLSELSDSGRGAMIETLKARSESRKLKSVAAAAAADLHQIELASEARTHEIEAELDNLEREAARLRGALETSRSTVRRIQQEIVNHQIRAPADGRIGESAALQIGAYIQVGEKLASLVPPTELRIVADFPPASALGRIREGQRAQMRLDGFPWAQFGVLPAQVVGVGSEIRDNLVRVEFQPLPQPESKIILQHGLPGAIEVNIEQLTPAVLVMRKAGQWLEHDRVTQAGRGART
ncbi:MAG: HlyD family efflux transporter periplasmic adaptor subunit [Pseudomonadales bacterium]|nr:HlyD family efflux transporter periplasmic adaptor subunit [Pseudomonadales bacterium]MCP5184319.1 HlyD family efflux transporter periplasmic adaptor subunit [Pseudomonadales bacterium]